MCLHTITYTWHTHGILHISYMLISSYSSWMTRARLISCALFKATVGPRLPAPCHELNSPDSQSIAWDGQDFQSTFPELEPAVWFSSRHPVFTVFAAKSAACHPTWFVNRNCDSHAPEREREREWERERIRVHVMIWDYQNWRLPKLASMIQCFDGNEGNWSWMKLVTWSLSSCCQHRLLTAVAITIKPTMACGAGHGGFGMVWLWF